MTYLCHIKINVEMKRKCFQIFSGRIAAMLFLVGIVGILHGHTQTETFEQEPAADLTLSDSVVNPDIPEVSPIKKILFIGDSMTGWMAERLNAYGENNGFEVATIVWDGSTIKKWGASPKLNEIIAQQDPDAIFISLGMNELFEQNPQANLGGEIDKLKNDFGDIPFLWIGPPSWPGHDKGKILNDWLENQLGSKNFFRSSDLNLPRQSASNPHPVRSGAEVWIDEVVKWIPGNTDLKFVSLDPPAKGAMSRGKTFIYKRMKENL